MILNETGICTPIKQLGNIQSFSSIIGRLLTVAGQTAASLTDPQAATKLVDQNTDRTNQATNTTTPVSQKEVPENIIIIDNSPLLTNLQNSSSIKATFKEADPTIEIHYNYKLSKGGLALHAATSSDAEKIVSVSKQIFPNCRTSRPLASQNKQKVVVRNIPTNISTTDLEHHISGSCKESVAIHRFANNRYNKLFPIISIEASTITATEFLTKGINIFGKWYKCSTYIKPPIRCHNCQRFGHIKVNCRLNSQCSRCGDHHPSTLFCSNTAKCVNCHSHHQSDSKLCPSYITLISKINNVYHEDTATQHTINQHLQTVSTLSARKTQC
jgi:hypothetical protein